MRSTDDQESFPGSDRQWWLTEGPELCFVCEAATHPEVLAYCVACDRCMCSHCLYDSPEHEQMLCPECAAGMQESI